MPFDRVTILPVGKVIAIRTILKSQKLRANKPLDNKKNSANISIC